MSRAEGGSLADKDFWDSFWVELSLPEEPDPKNVFDRGLIRLLERHLERDPNAHLVEVGCAPGRWLVYCHRRFGHQVAGYESSDVGLAKTRENLGFYGIKANLIADDFVSSNLPANRYDVVLSLGFIEHFADPIPIIERHAHILRPNGKLILEVPNLRGLNHFLISRTRPELLMHHNLDVMTLDAIRRLGSGAGLEMQEVGYLGGIDTALFPFPSSRSVWRLVIALLSRARSRLPSLDRINTSWLSGYLYGVFRKS